MLSTFLFDLDGTLLDSVDLILRSYKHMLRQHRGIEGTDEMWLRGLGTPLKSQLKQFTEDPAEVAAMIETYREFNFAHHDNLAKPYEGVVNEVRRLDALGKTIAVVTSKYREGTLKGLRLLGIEDCIDFIVPADEVTHQDSDPIYQDPRTVGGKNAMDLVESQTTCQPNMSFSKYQKIRIHQQYNQMGSDPDNMGIMIAYIK